METTISDPNLRTDFNSVINYYFKKEISVLLSKLVESGQLTLMRKQTKRTEKPHCSTLVKNQ
jgi:hypothetical protein